MHHSCNSDELNISGQNKKNYILHNNALNLFQYPVSQDIFLNYYSEARCFQVNHE